MNWFTEYRNSLKNIHAEEFLDVYLFRPIAFVIIKTLYSFPLTPNHFSFMSFVFGMISSFYFYNGHFTIGALFFFLFAILDCCDGMQARMKKNGSEFGRFIDGFVDYTVNIAAYICLAIGTKQYITIPIGPFQAWHLVVLAGISKAIHSITFDHYLMEYLSYANGNSGFLKKELDETKAKLKTARENPNSSFFRLFALWVYLGFSSLQSSDKEVENKYDAIDYIQKNYLSIQLWGMIGPAWHIFFLILGLFFNQPIWLFLYSIAFGNLWLIFMFLYQQTIYAKIKKS